MCYVAGDLHLLVHVHTKTNDGYAIAQTRLAYSEEMSLLVFSHNIQDGTFMHISCVMVDLFA